MSVEAKSITEFGNILSAADRNLVVIHFMTDWAPQCKQINDVLDELAKDESYSGVKFVKVEAENLPDLSSKYEIQAVPTCILVQNGKVLDRVNGAHVPELTKKIQENATPALGEMPKAPKEDLNTRLKKIINTAPVMVFIKGEPEQPRCGFSKQVVQILKEQEVQYKSFDILTDEEVRQGLKKYSDWPTYPQIYINGELIGGLDIVKEMIANDEFKDCLPKQESLDDRLKKLINQEKIMVFMKGNPGGPKCGFSKTIVGILAEEGVNYGHFDILTDEEVRQELKKYSNWPTYPQVYVKGELIGGLDIVKEMKESGELKSSLEG